MTEKTLVQIINEELKKQKLSNNIEQSSKIFSVITDIIHHQLSEGQEIKIRGVGTFKSVFRVFRKDIKDANSETFQKFILKFVPSVQLTVKLNETIKTS
jgi:nucleoid DNA-binding protein